MADVAGALQLDVASGLIFVDGAPLPWAYVGGELTIEEHPETGEMLPGITLTILAASLDVISARTTAEVPDGQ